MKNSSGNVLFLILIAVALFAALSYAVTQSSRSGGGDASKETNVMNAALLSQYTSSLRTTIQRMSFSSVDITTLEFNSPEDFGVLTSPSVGVFHPQGGGAVSQNMPKNVMTSNPYGKWTYNMNFEIQNVGTSVASSLDGNDLVAFLIDVKKEVCEQVNAKLGFVGAIPSIGSGSFADAQFSDPLYQMLNGYSLPSDEEVIGWSGWMLDGSHEGCLYQNDDKTYVYYSVLVAR